jgi:hypothetical protein
MIHKLRAWYLHRRAVNREKRRQQGFDYVAGMLLRNQGDKSLFLLLDSQAYDVFHQDEFNFGMQDALHVAVRVGLLKYPDDLL